MFIRAALLGVLMLFSGLAHGGFSCISDGTGKTAVDWWYVSLRGHVFCEGYRFL
jgi:hypothetical protein